MINKTFFPPTVLSLEILKYFFVFCHLSLLLLMCKSPKTPHVLHCIYVQQHYTRENSEHTTKAGVRGSRHHVNLITCWIKARWKWNWDVHGGFVFVSCLKGLQEPPACVCFVQPSRWGRGKSHLVRHVVSATCWKSLIFLLSIPWCP